ncbi:MAG: 3-phosphoshikimate 1-carboxyvinyltransferase [Gemmatimonadetes bacterium]|nr:3-phosphoshikimate 1-carboxyvinyltransferase [Gemmatimonadota bacterium]
MTALRRAAPCVTGRVRPPGDKSLSHRALLFAALSGESVRLTGLNPGEDVASTAGALAALGVRVQREGGAWTVIGRGGARATESPFRKPGRSIDCGNSGTTMRLLAGVLAACPFRSRLTGDTSLVRRPMSRVAVPLRRMGAKVEGVAGAGAEIMPPLCIQGGALRGGRFSLPVASAQVKSAILLAAHGAEVAVDIVEPGASRDHTERMMDALGLPIRREKGRARLRAGGSLASPSGRVPADPSAGAFLAAAAAALPGSDLWLEGICLNPTRLGFYRVLSRMGARIDMVELRRWCGEPVGNLRVRAGTLHGVRIGGPAIPSLLDEIPVLAVLAAGACRGTTRITGAGELRVKESDRLAGLAEGLGRLGARVTERPAGLIIEGGELHGGTVDSHGDHRLAMAFRVASLLARGRVRILGSSCIRVSDPGFDGRLRRVVRRAK